MNDQNETVTAGPAVASAEAIFNSDHAAIEAIRDSIGYVRMCVSSSQFAIKALERCVPIWDEHAIGHISRTASKTIRRRLHLSAVNLDFDPEDAYKIAMQFFHESVLDEIMNRPKRHGIRFMPTDARDELAIIMALSTLNNFIVMFEVHTGYKENREVSPESVIAEHRQVLVHSRLGATRAE